MSPTPVIDFTGLSCSGFCLLWAYATTKSMRYEVRVRFKLDDNALMCTVAYSDVFSPLAALVPTVYAFHAF